MFLVNLKLQNFCSYKYYNFNFKKPNGSPYPFICFFGPNGIGKSMLLEAITLLTANQTGRNPENIRRSLQKYIRNKDYNPSYDRISGHKYKDGFAISQEKNPTKMIIEGTYELDGKQYIVRLNQDGFERNDFVTESPWGDDHLLYRQRIAHFITSDSDLSMSKFQLRREQMKQFESITSKIMRYPTECIVPSGFLEADEEYCTDFIILKKDHRIHYKRMSAGEKKISKSFSELLNLTYDLSHPDPGEPVLKGWPPLLLLDNIEMHIYYDRHVDTVQCMKENFPKQQIFATTHSGILIERFLQGKNDQETELMINLEEINY